MNPDEFIAAAARLAAISQGSEALLRSAVSRAYYGVFHLALGLLSACGIALARNANAHVRCQRLLLGSRQPLAVEIAGLLGNLHSDRIRADYRLDDGRFADFARVRLRVERADQAARLIAECIQDPARSEIASALRSCVERGM